MNHFPTRHNGHLNHYAAGHNDNAGLVLVQISQDGKPARISLTPDEARHFASLLLEMAEKIGTTSTIGD